MIKLFVKFTGDSSFTDLSNYNGNDLIFQQFEHEEILCDREFKPAQSELKIDVLFSSVLFSRLLPEKENIPCYVEKTGVKVFSGFANCDLSITFTNGLEVLKFTLYDNSSVLENITVETFSTSALTTIQQFIAAFLAPIGITCNSTQLPTTPFIPSYIVEKGETISEILKDILWHLGITYYFNGDGVMVFVPWTHTQGSPVATFSDANGTINAGSLKIEIDGKKEKQTTTAEITIEAYKQCSVKEYKLAEFVADQAHILGAPIGVDYGSPDANVLVQYGHIHSDHSALEFYAPINKLSGVEKVLSLSNLWIGSRAYGVFGYTSIPGYIVPTTWARLNYMVTPYVFGNVGNMSPGETVFWRNYAKGNIANVDTRPYISNWLITDQDGEQLTPGRMVDTQHLKFTGTIHGDNFPHLPPGSVWLIDRKFMGLTELRAFADIVYLKKTTKKIQAEIAYNASSKYLIYADSWAVNLGSAIKNNIINNNLIKVSSYVNCNIGDIVDINIYKNNLAFKGKIIRKSYKYDDPREYMRGIPVEYDYELVEIADVELLNPALGDVVEYKKNIPGENLSPWITDDGTLAIPVDTTKMNTPVDGYGGPIDDLKSGLKIDAHGLRLYSSTDGSVVVSLDALGNAYFKGQIEAASGHIGGFKITAEAIASGDYGVARLELNKTWMRMSVWSSGNAEVTAMGYLGGLKINGSSWQSGRAYAVGEYVNYSGATYKCKLASPAGTLPTNTTYWMPSTDMWTSSDYGFWALAGNSLKIDGDVTLSNGDWLIQHDASFLIKNSGTVIARLGSINGSSGLFLNETLWNSGSPTGFVVRITPSDFFFGNSSAYLKFSAGALEFKGTSFSSSSSATSFSSTTLTFNGSETHNGSVVFSAAITINNKATFTVPVGAVGSNTGGVNNIQIYQATASTDAFISFNINGDYAVHFGLDGTTNDLFVGGWSLGENKYKVLHEKNFYTYFAGFYNTNYIITQILGNSDGRIFRLQYPSGEVRIWGWGNVRGNGGQSTNIGAFVITAASHMPEGTWQSMYNKVRFFSCSWGIVSNNSAPASGPTAYQCSSPSVRALSNRSNIAAYTYTSDTNQSLTLNFQAQDLGSNILASEYCVYCFEIIISKT